MNVLIVDDEPLARKALEKILHGRVDVDRIDFARDAIDALEKLDEQTYHVLLIDIQMPQLSGIELAAKLNQRPLIPAIIFVTAHQEHAIAAFKEHALDYVLKPFSEERIHEALNVAFRRSQAERAADLVRVVPKMHSLIAKQSRIAIKAKGRILFIDPKAVAFVEAQGSYVVFQGPQGSYLMRESLSRVAEKLKPYGFVRIHRSVLVNTLFVEEIQPWPTGEYVLRIKGGKELTVSRKYKNNLSSMADWIGSQSFSH